MRQQQQKPEVLDGRLQIKSTKEITVSYGNFNECSRFADYLKTKIPVDKIRNREVDKIRTFLRCQPTKNYLPTYLPVYLLYLFLLGYVRKSVHWLSQASVVSEPIKDHMANLVKHSAFLIFYFRWKNNYIDWKYARSIYKMILNISYFQWLQGKRTSC